MTNNVSMKNPNVSENDKKLTVYVLSVDWDGLHEMFETKNWDSLAGVPLVPLYWVKLAEKGHNVHVFVWGDFESKEDFMLKGVHFHRGRIPAWSTSGVKRRSYMAFLKIAWFLLQLKSFHAVRKVAQTDPPDIIYSYSTTFVPIGHVLSRLLKIPHAVHLWGTWLGHVLFNLPWYKRLKMLGGILALKFPLDLLIISNDGTLGDKVVERLKFPKERFRFWLDGTSPDIYQPEMDFAAVKSSVGLKPTDKMILHVARLDYWKRIDRTIAALPTIIERVPDARLVVAGDGILRKELEKQAQDLGVSEYVRFLGSVPHHEVLKLHNTADIFITVQDLTNLGNQTMEALHSGTCVIAYDIGATSDVMVDGVTGRLLKEEELSSLGDVISELLLDDTRRRELAQGALDFARKNIWSWDQRINAELAVIQDLIAQHKK